MWRKLEHSADRNLCPETPPRMWRKRLLVPDVDRRDGNTSTYVEKTPALPLSASTLKKHLHVCGENFPWRWTFSVRQETPPRMWRKQSGWFSESSERGNTSTYVEKTFRNYLNLSFLRKHLHVCGENWCQSAQLTSSKETPPRMWRKLKQLLNLIFTLRNTSTYVEKTKSRRFTTFGLLETPPRMWRKPIVKAPPSWISRNTSTYVEKTETERSESVGSWKHLHVCGENFLLFLVCGFILETPPRMWRKQWR